MLEIYIPRSWPDTFPGSGGGCNLRCKRFEGLISGVVGRNFRKFL